MLKSGFDECVGITRFTMNVIGIWPGTDLKAHWYSRFQFLVPVFFMIFFINVPQTRMLPIVWGNLNTMLEILTTADIIIGLACVKLLGIWYNKQDLRYLLTNIAEDWKMTSKDHQQIMWQNVKLCKTIMTGYLIVTFGTIVVYAIGMLVVLNFPVTEEGKVENVTTRKPMFVISKFFFETQSSPIFEIIWICQLLAGAFGTGAFTSFDGFFIFSILHLCAQLSNLQLKLKSLIFRGPSKQQSFVQSLGLIVKRHIQLYRFTCCIEENFNKVFLVQMICYSVTLCLQGYQLVTTLTEDSKKSAATLAFILIFTSANIMSLFMYCFVAEKLRSESGNIFLAAYEMNWTDLKTAESKMLLNVMYISKSPFEITAGKFGAFSFEYFIKVLKTAAGYLSMLLAVKSRNQTNN